jgi:hypothetical protein
MASKGFYATLDHITIIVDSVSFTFAAMESLRLNIVIDVACYRFSYL